MPKLKIKVKLFKVLFKPKNLLVKISHAFSSKKSQDVSAASRARNRRRMTMGELLEEEKSQALEHAYYKSLSLNNVVEARDMQKESGGKTVLMESKKKCGESPGKQISSTASSSRFSNFIRKKTKFSFSKWKINKKKKKNAVNVGDDPVRKKQEGSILIGRLSDRKSAVGEEGGDVEHEVEEKNGEKEEGGVGGGFELCRRRILMGGKCKPLNGSGTLRYDESGILLPEDS